MGALHRRAESSPTDRQILTDLAMHDPMAGVRVAAALKLDDRQWHSGWTKRRSRLTGGV